MIEIYVLRNKDGKYYDFFDHSWNDTVDDCIAPYIDATSVNILKVSYPYDSADVILVGLLRKG